MKIYLMRHAQTDTNIGKVINGRGKEGINEEGRKQANQIAEMVNELNIDLIISSPLNRAIDTAQLINKRQKNILLDSRLTERDAKEFYLKPFEEINEKDWNSMTPEEDYGTVESMQSVYDRSKEFLDEITSKYKGKNILIISHYGVLTAMIRVINDYYEEEKYEVKTFKNCEIREYELM